MKLSTLLGLKDKVEKSFKSSLADMAKKFKTNQGLFKGERRTHVAINGYFEEPSKIGYQRVNSTVHDQLKWHGETALDFFNTDFSIEKTNASGRVKAELVVDGVSWGTYTSLELLRLKTTLANPSFKDMYDHLPIRSTSEIWVETTDSEYAGKKGIYESRLEEGMTTTTEKEKYILNDPHAGVGNRPPIEGMKETRVQTGNTTSQKFSGEISMFERSTLQDKIDLLEKAVIAALEEANAIESETSDLGAKLNAYLVP